MNISTKFHACIRMCMIIVISRSTTISINDREILPFRGGLFSKNFAYAKFCKNNVLAKIFKLQYLVSEAQFQ